MSSDTEARQGARVIFVPPPMYYAAGLAGGMAINAAVPLEFGGRPATTVAGVVVAALGLGLAFAGVSAVARHHTTIVPHRPVTTLLTGGVYRLSRNPMYAGLAIVYFGLTLVFGSWWPLVLGVPVIIAIRRLVIRPEEQYLAQRFGPAFTDYRSRVRRWL